MANHSAQQAKTGYTIYNRIFLSIYDLFVLGFLCRVIWNCPSKQLLENYNKYITLNHLDVGVGTGYFLDHCKFPTDVPRLGLMDFNNNCLDVAQKRLSRYSPDIYCQNVLEPIHIDTKQFDSVAVNGLLHCLPGTIATKGIIFDHLKPLMNSGCILFGCTLLNKGIRKSQIAQWTMNRLNERKVFTNLEDDLKDLKAELSKRFLYNKVRIIGCMALFWARN